MTYRGQFRQSRGSIEIEHIATRPASPEGARLTLTGNLRSIFCQTAKLRFRSWPSEAMVGIIRVGEWTFYSSMAYKFRSNVETPQLASIG